MPPVSVVPFTTCSGVAWTACVEVNVKRSLAARALVEMESWLRSMESWRVILPELRSTGAARDVVRTDRPTRANVVILILSRFGMGG